MRWALLALGLLAACAPKPKPRPEPAPRVDAPDAFKARDARTWDDMAR